MTQYSAPFANKDLGQHFLNDEKVIETICQDIPPEIDLILEIGPGPGALTKNLAELDVDYFVIEKDKRFIPYLEEYIDKNQIILSDALKFDLKDFLKDQGLKENSKIWLVSNLPYNIAAPIFVKFIQMNQIAKLTLMFQKEVAQKIAVKESIHKDIHLQNKKAMGPLLILSHNYFKCRYLLNVLPGAFLPPPKVDSGVISITRKDNPIIELADFSILESFLRKIFSQRRKQLKKVLQSFYSKEVILKTFEDLQFDLQTRAEALSVHDIINLYKTLTRKVN